MKQPRHDITGQTFGKLYVEKMEKVAGKYSFQAFCRCLNCGKKRIVVPSKLKAGHTKSCGCLVKHRAKNNIIGQKFGYLEIKEVIKEFSKTSKRYIYYAICKCHKCGNENFKMNKWGLRSKKNNSCGCDTIYISGKNHKGFTGYEEISKKKWKHYEQGAKKRDLEFSITIKDGWELFLKQNRKCALSGILIEFGKSNNSPSSASLDRIDSNKGYTIDNVQWVHKDVNYMKWKFNQSSFIKMCRLIAENNNGE